MSTQRFLKLPAGVSLRDAGTNSLCHCRIPARFLHTATVNIRIPQPGTSRRTVMAVALIALIEMPNNISLFKSP
jgi:hypothetical protein